MGSFLLIILALCCAFAALQSREEDQVALSPRDLISWGGYALRGRLCPFGTSDCGSASCCPNGYIRNPATLKSMTQLCCPSGADSSWTLWQFIWGDRFCCDADEVGTYDPNVKEASGFHCYKKNLPVPSSIIQQSLIQQTATRAPAGGSLTTTTTTTTTTTGGILTTGTSGSGSGFGSGSGSPGNNGPNEGGSSHSSGLPQTAAIPITVLATIIGLMGLFIWWLIYDRRKKQQPPQPRAHDIPSMSQASAGPHGQTSQIVAVGGFGEDRLIELPTRDHN